jgi:hypothetical protein
MSIKLTDLQRSVLCWLETTGGVIPKKEGLFARNSELGHEIIMTLQNLDLLNKEVWEDRAWTYPLTEEGVALAKTYRYGSCPSCVRGFCVCRVRLVCASGCGSQGCHGSHE